MSAAEAMHYDMIWWREFDMRRQLSGRENVPKINLVRPAWQTEGEP